VVLCGPSRSSKTALCALLMMRGLKCANVPLVPTLPNFPDGYKARPPSYPLFETQIPV
jgi:regulator of PEP synthase PpsR (kinase-PPPase family)